MVGDLAQSTKARSEVLLAVWELLTGRKLSDSDRRKFLAKPEVHQLFRHRLGDLVDAGRATARHGRLPLAEWIAALERLEPPVREAVKPRATGRRVPPLSNGKQQTGGYSGLRSRDGRFPQRPVDTDLAKKIGPVQRYDDTF